MSGAELAKTTFAGGPNELLLAVDAYTKKASTTVINSIQNIAKAFGQDILNALDSQGLKEVKDLISKVNDVAKLNPEAIAQRLLNNNELQSAYRQLTADIKNGLNIDEKLVDSIEATVNGITTQIKSVDFSSVKSIATMVNNLTHGHYAVDLLDKGALSGMLTSLTTQASSLGLKGTFTAISEGIEDPKILINAAKTLLPLAVKPDGLELFIDLCGSKVKDEILNVYPNVVSEVIANFKKQVHNTDPVLVEFFDTLSTTFTSVDPTWNKQNRLGQQVLSIYNLTSSTQFQSILEAKAYSQHKEIPSLVQDPLATLPVHDEDEKFLLLSKVMGLSSCKAELQKQFPFFNITVDEVLSNHSVTDPSFIAA